MVPIVLGALLLGLATPYADLVGQLHRPTTAHLSSGVFALFALLLGASRLTHRRWWAPSPADLVFTYAVWHICASISSTGFVAYLLPMLAAPRYFSSPSNQWDQLFLNKIPTWFAVLDNSAVRDFYQGTPSVVQTNLFAWMLPLTFWLTIGTVYFGSCLFLALFLERKWIVDEKLTFPTVQVGTAPLRARDWTSASAVGILIPFFFHSLNNLSASFSFLPRISMTYPWGATLNEFPFDVWQGETLTISGALTGIGYLIPADVAVSFWGFYWMQLISRLILRWRGMAPGVGTGGVTTLQRAQEAGGFLVLASLFFTTALRSTAGNDRTRSAVQRTGWLFILSILIFVLLLTTAGLSFSWGLVLMMVWTAVHVVLTRIVSAGGVMRVECSFMPWDILVRTAGVERVGWRNLAIIAFPQQILMFDQVTVPLPYFMDGFKLRRQYGFSLHRFFTYLATSYTITLVTAITVTFYLCHRMGALTVNNWFTCHEPTWAFHKLSTWRATPFGPDTFFLRHMVFGMLIASLISQAYRHLNWWSVSPLGFVMATTGTMRSQWFPIFLGWLIRSLTLRLQGLRGYHSLRPFFFGLIWGELLTNSLWMVISLVFRWNGVPIFPPE